MATRTNRVLGLATEAAYNHRMRIVSGKVVDGKIVVDEPLDDGVEVKVVISGEADAGFELSSEQEAELLEAIAEANAGQFIDGDELLRTLHSDA